MFEFVKGRLIAVRVILLATTVILIVAGITVIYAVGNPADPGGATDTEQLQSLWKKQLAFTAIAAAAFLAVNAIHYRRLGAASAWIYAAVLLLLAVLLLDKLVNIPFVPVVNQTRRWIRIAVAGNSVSFQPSELCKLAYLLALAWYLRYRSNYRSFTALVGPFILTIIPMLLILLEPDLGTVMLMMPIFFVMLFVAGAKTKHLLTIILLSLALSPLMWHKMQPYQRTRISSVLLQNEWVREKAEQHPTLGEWLVGGNFTTRKWRDNWGYHLIRSKYAVASGGTAGYGFGKGPFVKYNFLPERHNDFVFALVAHQWGLLGCLALLGLYVILIMCGLEIAAAHTDPFARLLAVGITTMFAVEVIVNVSMTVGLMPITGLTLPFVSYGGSSLVVSAVAVGLLNNIGRSRPFSVAPER